MDDVPVVSNVHAVSHKTDNSQAQPQAADVVQRWDHQYTVAMVTDTTEESVGSVKEEPLSKVSERPAELDRESRQTSGHAAKREISDTKLPELCGSVKIDTVGNDYMQYTDLQENKLQFDCVDESKEDASEVTIQVVVQQCNPSDLSGEQSKNGDENPSDGAMTEKTMVDTHGKDKMKLENDSVDLHKPTCTGSKMCSLDNRGNTGKKKYVYGPVQCSVCSKMLSHKGSLQTHMLTHTKKKPFTCSTCGRSFSIKSNYKTHQLTHQSPKFPCSSCDRTYLTKRQLNRHTEQHVKNKQFGKQKPKDTCKGPQTCDICGKTIRSYSELQIHLRAHTGDKLYICDICGWGFNVGCNYRRHMLRHSDYKAHKCEVCPKAFYENRHLKLHVEKVHRGSPDSIKVQQDCDTQKPSTVDRCHRCDHCQATFKTKASLLKHHTVSQRNGGECHTSSSSTENEVTQQGPSNTRTKNFPCSVCKIVLQSRKALASHKLIHKEEGKYKCSVENCQATFRQSQGLWRHLQYHSDTKTHVCPVCQKAFAVKQDLLRHEKIHSVKKPTRHMHETLVSESASQQQTPKLRWLCIACKVLFRTKELLLEHLAGGCQGNTTDISDIHPDTLILTAVRRDSVDGVEKVNNDVLCQIQSLCQPDEQIMLMQESPLDGTEQSVDGTAQEPGSEQMVTIKYESIQDEEASDSSHGV